MTEPSSRIIGGNRPADPFDARTPDPGAAAEARARMWVAGIYEGPARPALFMDGAPEPDEYVDDGEARDRQRWVDDHLSQMWGVA